MSEEEELVQQRQIPKTEEELLQELRSRASELLLRKEWQESLEAYSQFITLCHCQISKVNQQPRLDPDRLSKLQKSLCLALSNRAEARFRLRDYSDALQDCDEALKIETTHFKAMVCKGKILLSLSRYSMALHCFKNALLDPQANGDFEDLNGYLEKCKKLEFQSKTGALDLSDWILGGFRGDPPELAEFIGAVQIERSEISGRGLFATKNMDAGSLILVTKAIATQRGILPAEDSGENAQMIMWKNFIEKVVESTTKCQKTRELISMLSTGEDEEALPLPDNTLFRSESEQSSNSYKKLDSDRILSILDVNSLVEDTVSAKVMGKNSDYYGVGLWVSTSFINHSCHPNSRRLHVGDHVIIHVSRDIKAGEEITWAYFDVLTPLDKRKEMSKTWGFVCKCRRCKVEEGAYYEEEIREIEMSLERGVDVGGGIFRLEEGMRRWVVRGKEKGYLRASFWGPYSEVYSTERLRRRWGRRIPAMEIVVDSVVDAVGSDERVLNVVIEGLKTNGSGVGSSNNNFLDMERAMKLGRGLYGKVAKKKAMRSLLGFD